MSVTSSLVALLKADATLQGLLATYASEAAVFGTRPVPPDATRPYLVTAGALSDDPEDSKNAELREVVQDLEAWTDAGGSRVTLEAITSRARALLHRQGWTVDGGPAIVSEVTGPTALPSSADVYGESLNVRVVYDAP